MENAKEARDKMVELSKKHSHVVLVGVILGGLVIILSYGIKKMIC